jgi:prolyl-tRNA synthetase
MMMQGPEANDHPSDIAEASTFQIVVVGMAGALFVMLVVVGAAWLVRNRRRHEGVQPRQAALRAIPLQVATQHRTSTPEIEIQMPNMSPGAKAQKVHPIQR